MIIPKHPNLSRKLLFPSLFACLLVWADTDLQAQSTSQPLTMALTGDAIITRKLSVYEEPEYKEMIDMLRSVDMAFTNLEMLLHDYEPYPMHQSGGTYMRGDPDLANELRWAGFDMVSTANNHTGDYGVEGMRLTLKYIRDAGIVAAGSGESLMEAREAKFLETAHGRIALISCASTFPDHSRAGKSRDDIPARPGLNPLRYRTTYEITEEHMLQLADMGIDLGLLDEEDIDTTRLRLFRQTFVKADADGITTSPRQEDLDAIAAVVHSASTLADVTIVTIHAHERKGDLSIPAEFVETFAQAMIDAGADMMVGHGPHVLRGIEIYKGKPIFYSLGDFMFQNETLLRLPHENYERYDLGEHSHVGDFNHARYNGDSTGFPSRPQVWESVIAMPVWENGEFTSITLHPITLGFGQPRQVRGRPMLADDRLSKKVIEDLIELSQPYGTKITFKNGIGEVHMR